MFKLFLFSFFCIFFIYGIYPVNSWGPVSHYYFACSALQENDPFECMKNKSNHNLIRGADLPDGLAGFASPAFQYGSKCPPASVGIALHNAEFGGYMLQWAQSQSQEIKDTIKGYSAHMIGDLVGFNPNGGYLSTGLKTKYGIVNWITMWPKMSAIDSVLMNKGEMKPSDLPTHPISQEVADFIAQSTTKYSNMTNTTFPIYSSSTVSDCLQTWESMIDRLYPYYINAMDLSSTLNLLVYFDQRDNKSTKQTYDYLMANTMCAGNATKYWWKAILEEGKEPPTAVEDTIEYVTTLYSKGMCY